MTTQSWYSAPPDSREPEDERPLGELFSDLTRSLQTLIRKELELAKVEMKEQTSRATRAGTMLGAGAVAGFVTLIILAFAAAWGLAEVMAPGVAFLIVGAVFGLVAVVLLTAGKKRLATVEPVPRQAVETLREDAEVAKASLSRGVHY